METVDRYLGAVRAMLPKAQQEDILTELSENIRAQIEDQEEELGRPLTPEEQETLLQSYGHPMVVAGRYGKPEGTLSFGKEVIGPELFPFYLKALKVLAVLWVITSLVSLTARSTSAPVTAGEIVQTFLLDGGMKLSVVTLVFAILQRNVLRHPSRWQERPSRVEAGESKSYVRFEAAVEFAVTALFLPALHVWLGKAPIKIGTGLLAPVWNAVYVPVLGAAFVSLGLAALAFVRPELSRKIAVVRFAEFGVWIASLAYIYLGGPWVVPQAGHTPGKDVAFFNGSVFGPSLLVTILFMAAILAYDVLKWRRHAR